MLNTAPPCHLMLCKISTFERAKQEAQLWASSAGNTNMFDRVIPRHCLNQWLQNNISQCRKIFSDDRGRQHWLLKKTAAMQSETDDRRTTGSIIQQKHSITPLFFIWLPLYVLTVSIQQCYLSQCLYWFLTACNVYYAVQQLNHNHPTFEQTQFAPMNKYSRGNHLQ